MLTLLCLSLDKFVAIAFNVPTSPYYKYRWIRPLTVYGAIGVSFAIWVLMFFFVLMPFIDQSQGTAYALQTSHLTCCWSWWRGEAIVLIFNVIGSLVIVIGGVMMTFAYYIIIQTVILSQQETRKYQGGVSTGLNKSSIEIPDINDISDSPKSLNFYPATNGKGPEHDEKSITRKPAATVAHKVSVEEKWLILNGLVISLW